MAARRIFPIALALSCCLIVTVTPRMRADDAKPDEPPKTVTKMYDIRPLTIAIPDFPFESSPHAETFVIPASGHFTGFGNDSGYNSNGRERVGPTREEMVEQLTRLITDTVAADTWRDAGGIIGSIREMNGILVVTQTAENQKAIVTLLHDLSEQRAQTLRTSADWVLLDPADVEKLIKPHANGDKSGSRVVDLSALKKLPATARHFHAEILSFNGQTTHFISGRERTLAASQVAAVGTGVAAYTPYIANIGNGIGLQITPVIDVDENKALVTVFTTYNDSKKPGPAEALHAMATTQAVEGAPASGMNAAAVYHSVDGIVQEFRTTVRMPIGVPTLAGSMTLEPTAKNAEAQELLLILTVQKGE